MVEALTKYGVANSAAAVDFFDDVMELEGLNVTGLMPSGIFTQEELMKIARYQAGKLRTDDRDGFLNQIVGSTGGLVYQAGNRAFMYQGGLYHSARQGSTRVRYKTKGMDTSPGTYQVRYARIPQGAETCDFCLMLASRGFVYITEESAEGWNHTHRGCDCIVIAGVGHYDDSSRWAQDTTLEGFDRDDMYNTYLAWTEISERYNAAYRNGEEVDRDAEEEEKLDAMEEIMGRREW